MKTIRNLINEQDNNISFCGDTEEVLKQDALEDIKELEKEVNVDFITKENEMEKVIAYIKFKYNLNEEE